MRFLTTSVPATGNTMGRWCWCCWSGSAQTWAALSVKVQPADNTSDLNSTISCSAAAGQAGQTNTTVTALAPVKHRTVLTGAFKCQIIMSTEATLRGIGTHMALRHSPPLLSMQLSELYRSFSHLPTFHISIIL